MNSSNNDVNDSELLTTERLFDIIDERYRKKNILYEHLHNSYNECINNIINHYQLSDNIIDETKIGDLVYKYSLKYENFHIRPATIDNGENLLYPMDAIDKKITYSLKIIAKVSQIQEVYNLNTKQIISTKVIEPSAERETLVQLPIMVHSKYCSLEINKAHTERECEYNPGGYFIVNGNEKVVMCIEKMIENKPLVFTKKEGDTTFHQVQINSRSSNTNIMMQSIQIRIKKTQDILIKVPIFKDSTISVFVIMRALGLETDKEIINYVTFNENDIDMINILKTAINLSKKDGKKLILNKVDAYLNLTGKLTVNKKFSDKDKKMAYDEKREHLETVLRQAFLPHLNGLHHNDILKAKAMYLGLMVHKLLNCYLGRTQLDDRDSFINKIIETPGDTLFEAYKTNYKKVMSDANKIFKKRMESLKQDSNLSSPHENPPNIINQIKPNTIKQNIESMLSTGTFGNKVGVAQPYQRLTYFQSLELLRRVDALSVDASTSKLLGPRHYNTSQVGMLCPVESPEHAKIGLVKHLTLLSSITINNKEHAGLTYNILIDNKHFIHLNNHNPLLLNRYIKVMLNGEWVGVTLEAIKLYDDLKSLKQRQILFPTTGIIYDIRIKEIRIRTEGGRLYKQFLSVKNLEIVLTDKIIDDIIESDLNVNKWDYLMTKYPEAIDNIDVDEQYYSLIAYSRDLVKQSKKSSTLIYEDNDKPNINRYDESTIKRYTHCEIHPQLVVGIIASNIPFSNHNQGPRNIFQYAQGKQAMGIYASNHRFRIDISYILYHCQRALVNTRVAKYTHANILPCGENAVVMIASYTGHNQEDSIIFNKSSIERGLFRSGSCKGYDSSIEKNQSTSQNDIFCKPDLNKIVGQKYANYEKLNDNGYVPEETIVNNNDVLIGKVTPIQPKGDSNKCLKDSSVIYKSLEPAIIAKVTSGIQNSDGYEMIKVKVVSERIPKIGDKFCSKHGNKGTIGLTLHQCDMPFTDNGMSPDIIINPIGVTQRRTIGQLLECVMGKIASIMGYEADGTAFSDVDVDSLMDQLEKLGFNRDGTEYMYSGITGEKMKMPIFIGPTYYQRLKHLVADKIHARASGIKSMLVRQPPEGRSKDGGLRLGEMERDCIIAHGMSKFLKEKFMENSDLFNAHICNQCGWFAQRTMNKNYKPVPKAGEIYICKSCNNTTDISEVQIPYAFKLLLQELLCLGIKSSMRTKKYCLNKV